MNSSPFMTDGVINVVVIVDAAQHRLDRALALGEVLLNYNPSVRKSLLQYGSTLLFK